MCRNIKVLRDYEDPPQDEEIEAAARQFVRKISGFNKPSRTNEEAFERGVEAVTEAARELLYSLRPTRKTA